VASGERGQKISDRDEYLEPTRQLVVPYRNKTKHGGRGVVYHITSHHMEKTDAGLVASESEK